MELSALSRLNSLLDLSGMDTDERARWEEQQRRQVILQNIALRRDEEKRVRDTALERQHVATTAPWTLAWQLALVGLKRAAKAFAIGYGAKAALQLLPVLIAKRLRVWQPAVRAKLRAVLSPSATNDAVRYGAFLAAMVATFEVGVRAVDTHMPISTHLYLEMKSLHALLNKHPLVEAVNSPQARADAQAAVAALAQGRGGAGAGSSGGGRNGSASSSALLPPTSAFGGGDLGFTPSSVGPPLPTGKAAVTATTPSTTGNTLGVSRSMVALAAAFQPTGSNGELTNSTGVSAEPSPALSPQLLGDAGAIDALHLSPPLSDASSTPVGASAGAGASPGGSLSLPSASSFSSLVAYDLQHALSQQDTRLTNLRVQSAAEQRALPLWFRVLYRYRGFVSAAIGGFLGAACLPPGDRTTVAVFLCVRAAEVLAKLAVARGWVPRVPHADTLLMQLASAQIIWALLHHPSTHDASYRKFLVQASAQKADNLLNYGRMTPTTYWGHACPPSHPTTHVCTVLHGGEPNCARLHTRFFLNGLLRFSKVYLPVYTVPLLLFRRAQLWKAPGPTLWFTASSVARSSLFLTTYVTACWVVCCTLRNVFLLDGPVNSLLCGIMGGSAVVIEKPGRRIELALFVASHAVKSTWRYGRDVLKLYRDIPYGECLLYAVSIGVLSQAFLSAPDLLRPTYDSLMQFFLGSSAELITHRSSAAAALRNQLRAKRAAEQQAAAADHQQQRQHGAGKKAGAADGKKKRARS